MLKHTAQEDKTNGQWAALDQVESRMFSHVIPRLLGALESEGRRIKPCLIHGDLWEGNTGTTLDTGNIYTFDAASFYAHNEMEIGDWRCFYNNIHNKVNTKTYLKNTLPASPRKSGMTGIACIPYITTCFIQSTMAIREPRSARCGFFPHKF